MTNDDVRYSGRQDKIDTEEQLDGIYVIRTGLSLANDDALRHVFVYNSETLRAYE